MGCEHAIGPDPIMGANLAPGSKQALNSEKATEPGTKWRPHA